MGPEGPQGPPGPSNTETITSLDTLTITNSLTSPFLTFNNSWRLYHNVAEDALIVQYNDGLEGWVKTAVLAKR